MALLLIALPVHAQWKTETFAVTEGWTAIYPLVDASDEDLDTLLLSETDIEEVWRWNSWLMAVRGSSPFRKASIIRSAIGSPVASPKM